MVLNDGEIDDDLVRDMVEVLTSLCARLYGRRSARNGALKAIPRPPDTTPRAWPSEGAPSDTGSGDAWHRPNHTRVMWLSIGPRRPNRAPGSVRQPATPGQDHRHDLLVHPGRRTREARRPTTVRGRPPSKTQFRSVLRNGYLLCPATAQTAASIASLTALVTYDSRLSAAAKGLGMTIVAPGKTP